MACVGFARPPGQPTRSEENLVNFKKYSLDNKIIGFSKDKHPPKRVLVEKIKSALGELRSPTGGLQTVLAEKNPDSP